MVDLALPVTRRGQWEEISFEEVGGVANVPRTIVEKALRAFAEDAARKERQLRRRSRALRDRNVRLARKRSIAKRRRELRAAFQHFFRNDKLGPLGLRRIRRHIKRFMPAHEDIPEVPTSHGVAFDFYCAHCAAWLCQNALHWYYD